MLGSTKETSICRSWVHTQLVASPSVATRKDVFGRHRLGLELRYFT